MMSAAAAELLAEGIPEMERVSEAWLCEAWPDLYPRLANHFPKCDEAHLMNWLRNVSLSNEYHLIHRGAVCGLGMRVPVPLEPPVVRVVFVSGHKDLVDPLGALLVVDIVRWAASLGAARVIFEPGVEVSKKAMMEHIELRDRREVYHRIKGG